MARYRLPLARPSPHNGVPMHRRCYATLCIRSDSPGHGGRTWARTEPALFGLFAQLLLNHTKLPLFVVHNDAVDPIAVLDGVVPPRHLHGPHAQVHPFEAEVLKGGVRAPIMSRHYESMFTKLHLWRLPCQQVVYIDYDVLTLRSPDGAFDLCGDEPFCAVYVGDPILRQFNGGVFVMQPSNDTYWRLRDLIDEDRRRGIARPLAEQELLNGAFPEWKALPSRYNVQGTASGYPYDVNTDVLIHEKFYMLPLELRAQLPIPRSLPEPTWLDYVVQFFAHFW